MINVAIFFIYSHGIRDINGLSEIDADEVTISL